MEILEALEKAKAVVLKENGNLDCALSPYYSHAESCHICELADKAYSVSLQQQNRCTAGFLLYRKYFALWFIIKNSQQMADSINILETPD